MFIQLTVCAFLLGVSAITASPFHFSYSETLMDAAPKTDIGAFSVDGTGHVYLYYESKNNLNSRHLNYVAKELNNQINFVSAVNSIKYADVPDRDLAIYVYSENSKNQWSEFVSSWKVPEMAKRCAKPTNVKLKRSKQMSVIEWMASDNGSSAKNKHSIDYCSEIKSYTVFWCESRTKKPNSCDGSIQFRRVPSKRSKEYSYHLKIDKPLIVAVSANSYDSSSGMVWLNDSHVDVDIN